jgi:hypothetical protein
MVKKGEETVCAAKEKGSSIKDDIKREVDDLRVMVAGINGDDEKEQAAKEDELFDSVAGTDATKAAAENNEPK